MAQAVTAMIPRWHTISAAVSALLAFMLVLAASRLDARKHYLSFGRDFHVSVSGFGLNFYSDARYGPYGGSIIGFSDSPDAPRVSGFNLPFYYRHFRWPNGHVMWTLSIMLPLVLLPFTILPAVWLWQQVRRRHVAA